MKPCTRCGKLLADDAAYCDNCNTEQPKRFDEFEIKPPQNATFLKVLCILTILGVSFTLISSAVSLITDTGEAMDEMRSLTVASLVVGIAKLTAAILMLQRKLVGLYIYTVAAVIAVAIQIYAVSLTAGYVTSTMGDMGDTILIVSAAITVVIALTFIILYWLPVNRRLLS